MSILESNPTSVSTADPIASSSTRPELLAPAGDRDCLRAAVENGADAVYFGLRGHNARARAANFEVDDLPEVMPSLHRRGVRGYVTLNTLVFPDELADLEHLVRRIAEAGVDAVIVQDLGLTRLIRAITPDLEVHASTQMSVTSAEGVRLAEELGCSRVILARELSLKEIGKIRTQTAVPVEVFVHGALCVAYSGQCLTSEALGGRSANRGQCAQACRMPYEIVCDGQLVDLEQTKYLLSPQDLAAHDLIPELIALGVTSLKIEGRLKSPEYVANITGHYRRAIDQACRGETVTFTDEQVRTMEMAFSRGFSHGFFDGLDHKVLVRGDYAKKRGVFLGTVRRVEADALLVDLHAPLKKGDGVVLDALEERGAEEQGGRIYGLARPLKAPRSRPREVEVSADQPISSGPARIRFGRRDIDLRRVVPGQRLWKTDDPELTRRFRKTFQGPTRRKMPLDVRAVVVAGQPLRLIGVTEAGVRAEVEADIPLEVAHNRPADLDLIRDQIGRLGDSIYELRSLDAHIEGRPMLPKSLANDLRRRLVARIDELAGAQPLRAIAQVPVLQTLREGLFQSARGLQEADIDGSSASDVSAPELSVLCARDEQVEAALRAGVRTIYVDYQDIQGYKSAVPLVRGWPEARIFLATPRIQMPAEAPIYRFFQKQEPDGLLVRNAGGLLYCAERGLSFVTDFSLNAANELTVEWLRDRGAQRVTASHDLNLDQLVALQRVVPREILEIVIHLRMPMFHMAHCVFCAFLSPGHDKTDCGRPCDHHDVKLRDRVGVEHPLKADVGCRNTLYNAVPQTAAEYLPRLLKQGARHLRIEFLDDSSKDVERIIQLYREALDGRRDPQTLWKQLRATSNYGITRGQLPGRDDARVGPIPASQARR